AGVLAVLAVAPVALRQVAPVATMLVIVAALVAYALLGYGDWPSSALGLLVAMFTVATLRPRRVAAALFPAAIAVIALAHRTVDGVTW
ncbi:hypothetical protein LI094_13860, partial [[Clostridium] saccharogumia]|uniref:hypothetical protein n=1 Tax=Thomasclavelia saccharogumia TaxID=341225 RepID=UPI001D0727FB